MTSRDVAHYYDSNTRRFLWMGSGDEVHAIHRELWGPGVESASGARDHINHLVADSIASLELDAGAVIVDFGCGVGGTLFHLARRFPAARLSGLTVSGRQVEIARRLAVDAGCADRCSFTHADFLTAELGFRADVIVAVESFTHSTSTNAFVVSAARHLRPGGRLFIADDFLASEEESLHPDQRRRVEQLRTGWRVPAICTATSLASVAAGHGLAAEKTVDLTTLTRPGSRVRDRLTAALSPVLVRLGLERIPFYGNMIGGHALQVGLREGFLRYTLLVFRRTAEYRDGQG